MNFVDSDGLSDLSVPIQTVADLRKLISNADDNAKVYFFYGNTVYDVEAELRQQECIEHSGKRWVAEGLIIQIEM